MFVFTVSKVLERAEISSTRAVFNKVSILFIPVSNCYYARSSYVEASIQWNVISHKFINQSLEGRAKYEVPLYLYTMRQLCY